MSPQHPFRRRTARPARPRATSSGSSTESGVHDDLRLPQGAPRRSSPAAVSVNVEPAPGSLVTRQRAAEQFRQPARQRQAEAGAAHAALEPVLELRELFEDPLTDPRARCRCRCRRPRNATMPVGVVDAADTRTSPRSVNFNAFEIRLRRTCDTLRFVGVQRRHVGRRPRTRARPTAFSSSGRNIPRSAPNRFSTSKFAGRTIGLAGFHLGEVEQVVDQIRQLFGRLADVSELRFRLTALLRPVLDRAGCTAR